MTGWPKIVVGVRAAERALATNGGSGLEYDADGRRPSASAATIRFGVTFACTLATALVRLSSATIGRILEQTLVVEIDRRGIRRVG